MFKRLILCVTLVAACGGDDEIVPERADAGPVFDARPGQPDATPTAEVFALGTDFGTAGVLSKIAVPSLDVTQNFVAAVASTDPVMRVFGNKAYIVNRFGFDNVTIVDLDTGTLVDQISTGAGTNPQDVAVQGDTIYVAALGSGNIIVLDAANPSATPGTIDISSYDTDGIPDASSIYRVADTLFVTIGALDDTFAATEGKVILIDTVDDEVSGDFDLVYNNPFGLLQPHGDQELITTTTEDFGAGAGCVERITATGVEGSAGCLVENSALGGYASSYRSDGDLVHLTVSTSFTEAKLVTVFEGTLDGASITASTVQPTDVAVCPSGYVVVGDATGGGLRIYGGDGTELTTEVLDIGQPPAFTNGLFCR